LVAQTPESSQHQENLTNSNRAWQSHNQKSLTTVDTRQPSYN